MKNKCLNGRSYSTNAVRRSAARRRSYRDGERARCQLAGKCRSGHIQLGNAAVNLAAHALRERPKVQVQRHQHHDVTQRARIGLGDLDKSLPERLASLRQSPYDLVYDVDAKLLAHV